MSNYNSSTKGKLVAGTILIIILILTAAFAGCLEEDTKSKNGSNEESEGSEDQPDDAEDQPDDEEVPEEEDEDEDEPPQGDEGEGTIEEEGTVETLAQASSETVTEEVDVNIPENKITSIEFVVRVHDGDVQTNADEVSGSIDISGMYLENLPRGQTPYKKTVNIEPSEGKYLPPLWTVTLEVECCASDDQWPGPMVWRGTPDHGFSYEITVTYRYLLS
jgi:hypothetical protein